MPDRLSVLRGRVPWPATALILAGIAAGIAAREADYAQARWLSDIANYPGTAIFVLALIARFSPTSIEAAARSAGFFAALSLAYYTWGSVAMGLEAGSYVYLWTALSLTIVPLLAMLVHWAARQRGAVPGLLMAGVAAGVIADGAIRQMWLHYVLDALPPEFPLHPVQAVANVAFALIIAAILPRYTETRLWALALAVPLSLPAHVVIDRAYGGLLT